MSKLFDFLFGEEELFSFNKCTLHSRKRGEEIVFEKDLRVVKDADQFEEGKLSYYDGSKWIEYE
jgi:hypothetical protein